MTMFQDAVGLPISGATPDALHAYGQACDDFRCLSGDPLGRIEAALASAPAMPIAHVFKGYLYALSTEAGAMRVARDCAAAALRSIDGGDGVDGAVGIGSARERCHAVALATLARGHWREAGNLLADVARRWPLDALALQAGHQIDFFVGDAASLRGRIAAALPARAANLPGYHALLGMHAFGLEECGEYDAAERSARAAIALEPRDSWAWHAAAHCFEMRDRPADGIAWLAPSVATWSGRSLLATHLHWHLALFHLELDEHDAVLAAWDAFIGGTGSTLALNLVDAASMLWRLHLRGVDVGDRWTSVADRWARFAAEGHYAFNDLHAMLAFVRTNRVHERDTVLSAQRRALSSRSRPATTPRRSGCCCRCGA